MTRFGITGHTDLAPHTTALVAAELRALLGVGPPPLVGVTCMAPGADQVFAEVVLSLHGRVEAVLPSEDYRAEKVDPADGPHFDALLGQASDVRTMPFATAGPEAYRAAGEAVLDVVDRLVAVWDGVPGGRLGSTGDLVVAARERGLPVTVVWPDGARRG